MSQPAHADSPADAVSLAASTVERLRRSFESGRTRPREWRLEQLARMKAMILENREAFLEALAADLRKPELEAWTTDLAMVVGEVDLTRKKLRRWMRPERAATPAPLQPARSWIVREPLGVVLVIAPWNYPVQLLLMPAIGAIAAGNAVVLKPSELTAHVSETLAKLVPRYLDPEAVALVEGAVPETTALLEQRFDHIFYTGNGRVGRVVMEAAAKHLTPVTLELGGKSPCLVDETADVALAARRIAWGKFLNAGQTCIAPDYVLVHESQEEALLQALREAVHSFYGDDPKASPDYARIVNDRHQRRLEGLLGAGETVFGGESDASQRFIAPTVLRGVPADAPVMAEEIFGPILPVLRVRDLDEALAFVKGRDKPLALYLFTGSAEAERRVVDQTSSGGVCLNGTIWQVANASLPFGGVGPSGMGAYHGRASFEAFSHHKSVVRKATWIDVRVIYPPYGKLKKWIVEKMI